MIARPRPEPAAPSAASIEDEEAVIGSLALEPSSLPDVYQIIREEDFYSPACRTIYHAMIDLAGRGIPCDLMTLHDTLERAGKLEEVGGREALARIMDCVPSPANVVHYAEMVHRKAILRASLAVLEEAREHLVHPNGEEVETIYCEVRDRFDVFAAKGRASGRIVTVDAVDFVEAPPPAPRSLVDERGLLDAGELAVIDGAPGSGKSLFLVNLAAAIAAGADFFHLRAEPTDPLPVLIVLAEYTRFRASQRLAGVVARYKIPRGLLHVWTREDLPNRLDLLADECADSITDLVKREGIGCAGFDSLSEIHTADEVDRIGMMKVINALRSIARTECADLAVHHDRKLPAGARGKGEPSIADMRGTTALPAALASTLACRAEAIEARGPRSFYAMWTKTNYSDPETRAFRFTLDNPASGVITGIEPAHIGGRPSTSDAEILEAMRELGGRRLQTKVIADALGLSTKTTTERLKALAKAGRIPPSLPGERKAHLWSLFEGQPDEEGKSHE